MTNMIQPRRQRRMGKWAADFIAQWNEAAAAGLTRREFSELHGVPYTTVTNRFWRLRRRGILLPMLPHGNEGSCHNEAGVNGFVTGKRKPSKLVRPAKGESKMEQQVPRGTRVLPTFCITVSAGG